MDVLLSEVRLFDNDAVSGRFSLAENTRGRCVLTNASSSAFFPRPG